MARNTLKSFQWSFFSAILRKAILFSVFLLIAKAITKDELGIFREFSLVLVIFTNLSFWGLKELLIVKKDNIEKNFKSLFSFSVISSFLAFAILWLTSNPIGFYYNSSVLADLIRQLAPLVIIEVFRALFRAYTQKRLKFRFLAIVETFNVVVYSSLIVFFFFHKLDIRTLVIVFYIGNISELVSYVFYFRNLVWQSLKAVFFASNWLNLVEMISGNIKFLVNSSINNFINIIGSDLPVIILGYLYDPVYIGIYYLANQLVGQIVVLSCNSLSQVLFPTFTFLSKSEIVQKISKFFRLVTFTAFPLFFLFVITVINIVPYILGDKWTEALPVVAILAFPFASTMLMNPIASIPYVFEKPHYEIVYSLLSIILKGLALYIGCQTSFIFALKLYASVSVLLHFFFLNIIFKVLNMQKIKSTLKIIFNIIPTLIFITIYYIIAQHNTIIAFVISSIMVILYLSIVWRKKLMKAIS